MSSKLWGSLQLQLGLIQNNIIWEWFFEETNNVVKSDKSCMKDKNDSDLQSVS